MKKKNLFLSIVLFCVCVFLFAQGGTETSSIQGNAKTSDLDFPKKPITLVCGWAAGGSSDLTCREIASLSPKYLGVDMNVQTMTGGNGAVSLTTVSKNTKSDGYTIALSTSSLFTTAPFISDLNFSADDYVFLTGVTSEPLAVVVRADSPLKNLDDVVAKYKKDGKSILHGQGGKNGAVHLNSLRLFNELGVGEELVAYSGASTALVGMLNGEVDMAIVHPGMALSQVQSGQARILAIVYKNRIPAFPDAKTVEEQGYSALSCDVFKFLVIKSDTDPAIIEYLRKGLNEMINGPEFKEFLSNNVIQPCVYNDDESLRNAVNDEIQNFWPIMEELGLLKVGAIRPAK